MAVSTNHQAPRCGRKIPTSAAVGRSWTIHISSAKGRTMRNDGNLGMTAMTAERSAGTYTTSAPTASNVAHTRKKW